MRVGPVLSLFTFHFSLGRRLPDGFEVEVAIPFKSLRFEPPAGADEILMGIGFKRNIPRKNEEVVWVNLTRFSLFFPEKRQFFLEGQQAFRFGLPREADLIFTRRIGLSEAGEPIRLYGGARLSGRQGRTTIGAMNLQVAGDGRVPSENFTVLRVKQGVLARSSVGAMFPNVQGGGGFNRVAGADASFYVKRVWFFDGWAAHVSQSGGGPGAKGGYGRAAYEADRYASGCTFLGLGEHFNPGVGFVRRPNSLQHTAYARFSPRPTNSLVRQYHFTGRGVYITDTEAVVDTREREVEARAGFETGDGASLAVTNQLEHLKDPFRLRPGRTPGTRPW